MLYRGQFQTDLDELQKSVLAMATSVSKLFQDSIEALHEQDKFRVETIINHDKKINEMEYAVIQKVNKLIAQQQPVASDLRRIIIAMKMANDLERMGDHGVNICKSILRMKHEPPNQVKSNINIMSDLAIKMLNISMASYENEDVRLAKQLKEMDEELDVLHRDNYMRISENIAQNKECSLETMMEFAFISRYIERFADHVTNIGENVFYLVKGERFDLNT
ncbi:phosphate signaling complex protein PhoU [Pontibacillus yanchengensis]|uniref:Phosphate-specific transport system accessory protein PhoU n=1 Tax=Pontibacillus yanchengensis Y32 TaxID=1385514 RepID=A0A0A2TVE4_9BACI|nr:phosphate signaling complex protein PhoU [Pontibacillus yanchengensis]KGP73250.1 PhoU family transcriptional regulator [Pontibacillus yanchengensis Y32]